MLRSTGTDGRLLAFFVGELLNSAKLFLFLHSNGEDNVQMLILL